MVHELGASDQCDDVESTVSSFIRQQQASVATELDEIYRKEMLVFETYLTGARHSFKQIMERYMEALRNEDSHLRNQLMQPQEKMELVQPQETVDYPAAASSESIDLNAEVAFERLQVGLGYGQVNFTLLQEHEGLVVNRVEEGECHTPRVSFSGHENIEQNSSGSETGGLPPEEVKCTFHEKSERFEYRATADVTQAKEKEQQPHERPTFASCIRNVVNGPTFDIATGMVILLNLTLVFVQCELQGYRAGHTLGIVEMDPAWIQSSQVFDKSDAAFNIIYAIELGLRLWVLRLVYFCDLVRMVDFVVVVGCLVDSFILRSLNEAEGRGTAFGRIVRLFRLLRLLKLLRFMMSFAELRILLRTLRISIQSLVWSMLLVGIVVLSGGMIILQLSFEFIINESHPLEKRQEIYREFGTSLRATYAMFEATFTAGWLNKARTLVEDVSPIFAIFWVVYIIVVNFALMRIVAALFLKQTMAVASQDAEKVAVTKMQMHTDVIEKLRELFARNDIDGDGMINDNEFAAIVEDPELKPLLEEADINIDEIFLVFHVLSSDGEADYEEFLGSLLKMRNSTRTVDIIQLLHEQSVVKQVVLELREFMKHNHLIQDSLSPVAASTANSIPNTRSARTSLGQLLTVKSKAKNHDDVVSKITSATF